MTLGLKATVYRREPKRQVICGRHVQSREGWRVSFMVYDNIPVFR
jgi:hypothetical protein